MLFKIAVICDEVEDFFREITIDADADFLALNGALLESCGYDDSQITCFYTCSDDWDKEKQIVREDMGTSPEDEDIYVMDKTRLSELIDDTGQKLIFIFDPANDRNFFLEVTDIVTGKRLKKPECTISRGKAPQQLKGFDLDFSTLTTHSDGDLDLDLGSFDDEGYNDDEFDPNSFGIDGQD